MQFKECVELNDFCVFWSANDEKKKQKQLEKLENGTKIYRVFYFSTGILAKKQL